MSRTAVLRILAHAYRWSEEQRSYVTRYNPFSSCIHWEVELGQG